MLWPILIFITRIYKGLNASFIPDHKIMHSCPLNICDTLCVLNLCICPLPFQWFSNFQFKFVRVKVPYGGSWSEYGLLQLWFVEGSVNTFIVVVAPPFTSTQCPIVTILTSKKNAFVVHVVQVISLFYLSISYKEWYVELNKARFLPSSYATCTNILLLGLHSMQHKITKDPLEKNIGIPLCEDISFKKLAARFEMLQWPPSHMMGGDPVSGAMMPPWRHACIQAPWDGLSLHVTWM